MINKPLLAPAHVHAVLEAAGYRSTSALLGGRHLLPSGCRISLQFGDQVATDADGAAQLTIRCSVVINGLDEDVSGIASWRACKAMHAQSGSTSISVIIETDVLLGDGISISDALAYGSKAYRHLLLLITDARSALQKQPVRGVTEQGDDAPVMWIEARFLRDIATGRSGIANPEKAPNAAATTANRRMTARHRQINRIACDVLTAEVLPDLARVIAHTIAEAKP